MSIYSNIFKELYLISIWFYVFRTDVKQMYKATLIEIRLAKIVENNKFVGDYKLEVFSVSKTTKVHNKKVEFIDCVYMLLCSSLLYAKSCIQQIYFVLL